jgi:hypothetical protein
MTLTKNQELKVREDIIGLVRDKGETSREAVFEQLNLRYTGVTLTDVTNVLNALCSEQCLEERHGQYRACRRS